VKRLRVALAQINTTVGDLEGNAELVRRDVARAREDGADVVAFPELTLTGYPPEDLLLRRSFVLDNRAVLERIAPDCVGITAIVGFVDLEDDLYNAAAVIHDGRIVDVYRKQFLPNYGVFDEERYFRAGRLSPVYTIAGVPVGVSICEDIWHPGNPTRAQAQAGAQVIININGSPYSMGKLAFRKQMLATRATDYGVSICYVNLVGGQDELVFDGGSLALNPDGDLLAAAGLFQEELLICDVNVEDAIQRRLHDPRLRKELSGDPNSHAPHIFVSAAPAREEAMPMPQRLTPPPDEDEEVYGALVCGTRDYLRKTGFQKALVALSGGIDSSLVAAIAVEALGAENVVGVSLPSRYSSEGSISDAKELAANLGMRLLIIPIEPVHAAFLQVLSEPFQGTEAGTAEENVQSRIRGNIAMALSNKFGWLVLTTGNKSEYATGYATLYGDMAGGYAVIKDVLKTRVYALSRYYNRRAGRDIIPQSVLDKPPSAELRPDQLDQDSLPPYDLLDAILERYVEQDHSTEEIIAAGFDADTVRRVIQMVDRNEYKRRQSPPGVKITSRAFGRDRRLPIANRYRG